MSMGTNFEMVPVQEIVNHTCCFLPSDSKKRGLATSEAIHLSTNKRKRKLAHSGQRHARCLLLQSHSTLASWGHLSPLLQGRKLKLKGRNTGGACTGAARNQLSSSYCSKEVTPLHLMGHLIPTREGSRAQLRPHRNRRSLLPHPMSNHKCTLGTTLWACYDL